ncbi:MAG: V4R domain-containing protein [Thermoplasmatota archaeon]
MAEEDARFVKLRKCDIASMRSLQETVMHEAAYGLQFRTGQALGSRIARSARPFKQQYFEVVRRTLVDEGWVRDIQFTSDTVVANGSIETDKGSRSTCHMLRGLLSKIYEGYFGRVTHCVELECESCGKAMCVFKMSFVEQGARRPAAGGQGAPHNHPGARG